HAWRQFDAEEAKYYLAISQDGSFVVDDVPPGNYELDIRLTELPADVLSNDRYMSSGSEIGALKRAVTIPEAPAEREEEPFDLGIVTVQLMGKSQSRK